MADNLQPDPIPSPALSTLLDAAREASQQFGVCIGDKAGSDPQAYGWCKARDEAAWVALTSRVASLEARAAEGVAIGRMILKASMGAASPHRGESSIGWQRGDGADSSVVRKVARELVALEDDG